MHLDFNILYNKNRFSKQAIAPEDTIVVNEVCPICEKKLEKLSAVLNRDHCSVLERSICSKCHFTTFTRMPSQSWFERFYKEEWDKSRAVENIKSKVQMSYKPLFEILLNEIDDYNCHILEIGSGYGGALYQLKNKGYNNVYGIEASERRQKYCKEQLGLNVSLTTAEKMEHDELISSVAQYDIVFSWHVIEHVFNLNSAFSAIARMIKVGGIIVIGIPHFEQEHIYYLSHFLPHIHSFTPKSITRLLNKYGFEVEYIDEQIRVVARKKSDKCTYHEDSALNDIEFTESLVKKVKRDFVLDSVISSGLLKNNNLRLFYEYDLKMGEVSHANVHVQKSMSLSQRVQDFIKVKSVGPGINLKPIFHPKLSIKNALDWKNMLATMVIKSMKFSQNEFSCELNYSLSNLNNGTGMEKSPEIDFTYNSKFAFCWIK